MNDIETFLLELADLSKGLALFHRTSILENKTIEKKADDTIVTEADKSISIILQNKINEFMSTNGVSDFVIIDEEYTSGTKESDFDKSRYAWIIDPIDGTLNYACGLNSYAISIALLEDGEPCAAIVILPSRHEIYMSVDGRFRYINYIDSITRQEPYKHPAVTEEIKDNFYIFGSNYFVSNNRLKRGVIMTTRSSVVNGVSTIDGSVAASIERVCIWDNAAIFVLAEAAGLKMYNYETGEEIEKLTSDLFTSTDTKKWFWNFTTMIVRPDMKESVENLILKDKA